MRVFTRCDVIPFVKVRFLGLGLILAVSIVFAAKPAEKARRLYEQGLLAERSGNFSAALLLYSKAAALDPQNPMYRLRSEAAAGMVAPKKPAKPGPVPGVVNLDSRFTEQRRALTPPELQASADLRSFNLRGDDRTLFEAVAHAYGLDCVFDGEYDSRPPLRFRMDSAGYREALEGLEAATDSFLVPLTHRLFLVARDTPQNRARLEPFVSVTVRIPQATTPQELTEIAHAVQQTMALDKVGLDTQQSVYIIRGPVSKVIPAQKLFEDLLRYHSQISIEMDIYEVDRSVARSYGLNLFNQFSAVSAGSLTNTAIKLADLARLGLNSWVFTLGVSQAQLLAQLSDTSSRSLLHLELRSEDGKPATFHVGDRYPVLTTGFFGSNTSTIPNLGGSSSNNSSSNNSSQNTSQTPSTFGSLPGPAAVVTGDFNEDGIPDLAAAASSGNEAAELIGNGDGTFQDAVFFQTGNTPSGIAAGDLNGDGHLDLVTADAGSNSVSILLGDGDGTFQPAVPYQTGADPLAVKIADFNGDGKPDLAVANADSNSVSILLGRGDGTFGAAGVLTAGSSPRSLISADFNGDGYQDLAVANYSSNDLWIFLGKGNGTFQRTQIYATGSGPSAIATDLLNSDNSLDLVVANSVSKNISVFLGDGTGEFVAGGTFATGSGPVSLQIGDVNSDGLKDVAAADSGDGTMALLLGLGDGTFETAITYTLGTGPRSIASGDFNKDGFLDFVVANYSSNNLSTLLGFGTAGFEDGNGNSYTGTGGETFAPTPSFNFEDLGLSLKVTPHVHGAGSISLDLDTAVKMLSGKVLNGLPIITNRQLTSTVDLPEGQTAVVAGLLTSQDAEAISGIPGLSQIPGINRLLTVHNRTNEKMAALILIKARLLSLPADQFAGEAVRLGSETRPIIPE